MAINSTIPRCPRASTPSSIFFTTDIVRNNECDWGMVSRRGAAGENPRYSVKTRPPPRSERTRAPSLWEKQCNCFGLMWTAAVVCPLEHTLPWDPLRGIRHGHTVYTRIYAGSLPCAHFAPPLIHSRSIIPKAETHCVYLRDALIYPAGSSLSANGFVPHFHLSPDRPVGVTRRGSRGINYFCN